MQRDDGAGAGRAGGVGEDSQAVVRRNDRVVHRCPVLPHREGGVGEVPLGGSGAGAVLADEQVGGWSRAVVGGDVGGEDVEHALHVGEGLALEGAEGEERGADAVRVGAIQRQGIGSDGSRNHHQMQQKPKLGNLLHLLIHDKIRT